MHPVHSGGRELSDRYVDEEDGGRSYQYYQPMYATDSCVVCHKYMLSGGGRRPNLQANDLMAMVRITTDYGPTATEVAKNQALLWTAAIVVGFVSMFSLWAVVRYVIVKPVTHLRDVANAVREGDVEQRASIRTGDEFEELAPRSTACCASCSASKATCGKAKANWTSGSMSWPKPTCGCTK